MRVTNVKLEGFDEAAKKLVPKALLVEPARRCLERIGYAVENRAKELVHVDRGRIRASITHQVDNRFGGAGAGAIPTWVVVGTNANHAPYVHEGRKPGSFPPVKPIREWAVRHGIPADAAFLVARKIAKKGIDPNPFLVNGVKDAEKEINVAVEKMGTEIKAAWEK